MIFLVFVAAFVALACVGLPALTLAIFCLSAGEETGPREETRPGRVSAEIRPGRVDRHETVIT